MRLTLIAALCFAAAGIGRAGDLNIHIMLSGEVAPGVYGQVQIGNERPPPLVYPQPMLIVQQAVLPPAVYLHVPPGHATNWRRHCREYNACNRPVYFVRSDEYEPWYARRGDSREHDHSRHDDEHERHHDHDYAHDHEYAHERGGREHHDEH